MAPNILVNFIIAGVQKGGSSALDAYLRKHPALCMAKLRDIPDYQNDPDKKLDYPPKIMAFPKEPHFFDSDQYFASPPVDYALYHRFFEPCAGKGLYGEATPAYTYWEPAARRMWEYNPRLKLIVLLRNPLRRAYSHWNMMRHLEIEPLSFEEALAQESERARAAAPLQNKPYSYIERGFYSEQLRRLWRFFPKEQVLLIKSEQLFQHPGEVLDEVCRFLEVAPFPDTEPLQVNTGKYYEPMPASAKSLLRDIFYGEIKTLENRLPWDCGDWLDE